MNMTYIRALAFGGLIALGAPCVTTQAQDNPAPETKESTPKTAKELQAEIQKLGQSLGRSPTEEQIDGFFLKAFKMAADYVRANPEAADVADVYKWAGPRASYGKNNGDFLFLAQSYLKANPDAKDAETWRKAYLCGGLAHADYKADAEAQIKKIDEAGKTDVNQALLAGEIRVMAAKFANDKEAGAKAVAALKNHKLVAESKDVWVGRDLMRIALTGSKAEIKVGEAFPCWSEVIEVKDLDGKAIKLADFKGKVVLIDFWAVWCGPCIAEMPNVVKAYETYKDKGFEVIGISFDRRDGETGLRETIKGEGNVGKRTGVMPWRQIYDGGFWDSGMAKRYGIRGIPHTVLIGADGKVVAQNLRGKALETKLAELLGEAEKKEGNN
ncbi:MAG: TlpA family protein disulfide reductase [Planctomycetes bacterium]|jgi:thiol-disulfide isomerase/thioredoxin|nr:TlpA family protein disulfide reductase [Planctomycetota bacterium]MCL4730639.1 TlpA family protein disulfide reductase [Planctomycetota bacterium]